MKAVVSLNSGSSSIKFALFTLDDAGNPEHSAGGKIEKIGIAASLIASVKRVRIWRSCAEVSARACNAAKIWPY